MGSFLYSEWDGSQELLGMDVDQIMDQVGKQVFRYGNLSQALRALQRFGLRDQGRQMPSLDKLLERLRRMKQDQLSQYNLDSVMDEIRQKLDKILETERQGIQKKLDKVRRKAEAGVGELSPEVQERLIKSIEDRAAQNQAKLNELPSDVGGQLKELTE